MSTNVLLDPTGLPAVPLYRQVSTASGATLIHVAGQVARDATGGKVGEGDLEAQVEQVYLNLATALASVGATFDDVVKVTAYIVGWTPDAMPSFVRGVARAADRLGIAPPVPPLTGIGVAALAEPDLLVEAEATAVLD